MHVESVYVDVYMYMYITMITCTCMYKCTKRFY